MLRMHKEVLKKACCWGMGADETTHGATASGGFGVSATPNKLHKQATQRKSQECSALDIMPGWRTAPGAW